MTTAAIDLAETATALVTQAGDAHANVHGDGAALARAAERVPPRTNLFIRRATSADLPGVTSERFAPAAWRRLAPLDHPGRMPPWFSRESHIAVTDEVRLIRIPGGTLLHLAHAPVLLSGAQAMVRDASGRFAPLVNHVPVDLGAILRQARSMSGTVFALGDEIQPLNYCHWLIDALPRLAVMRAVTGEAPVAVAVTPLAAGFQRETLRLCGFDDAEIIELAPMQALQAETLLATSDLPAPPHPAFKAAPWALAYLRARIGGLHGMVRARPDGRRLYLSRNDGVGRRILNEDDLMAALAPLGIERETLSGKTVREQAALLASTRFVVAPHGAGLANLVFAPPGAAVLELFPRSYGTPAYYVLAAGARLRYAYLTTPDVVPGSRTQLDDMRVDVAAVAAKCREMLRA